MNFTEQDLKQIEAKGLTLKTVEKQIERFKTGIPFTKIVEAATIGNGIMALSDSKIDELIAYFEGQKKDVALKKFVPASGAATRMFKFLFQFLKEFNPENDTIDAYIKNHESKDMAKFVSGMDKFPFYNLVLSQLQQSGVDVSALSQTKKVWHFVNTMLDTDQLNYGVYPKGLLPFHKYSEKHIATAFEEHLYEAALHAANANTAKIHFTISEQHTDKFKNEFSRIKEHVEEDTGIDFEITYSYQKESTDTIAVNLDNTPFRNPDGSLLFRPSGHGALIQNLNAVDADIIFIKNIDNVVVKPYQNDIAKYKKVLAGILLKVQAKSFGYLNQIDNGDITDSTLEDIEEFMSEELNVKIPKDYHNFSKEEKVTFLHKHLNRPIRVCGMVKNEGEPGGGPFWIVDDKGQQSLQIVETAQIDQSNTSQNTILQNATHFNPVDIVCGVKNYKGEKFNLNQFVNEQAAFITQKTKLGKELKALELPGLWNGGMAYWNTIFVEVPILTFNPVKTVNDLLKEHHQMS